jgi:NTP pyrophosphatase (non-canonical NTP hydrolase)
MKQIIEGRVFYRCDCCGKPISEDREMADTVPNDIYCDEVCALKFHTSRRMLREYQQTIEVWRRYNFGNEPIYILKGEVKKDFTGLENFLGLVEEIGELARAHLKILQGIRGNEDKWRREQIDAIGDIFIFLCNYCSREGYDLAYVVDGTCKEVLARDWTQNKFDGTKETKVDKLLVEIKELSATERKLLLESWLQSGEIKWQPKDIMKQEKDDDWEKKVEETGGKTK